MTELNRILLAEDNEHDVELTLDALAENHLANEVVVVRDGAEALDYLYRRGSTAWRCCARSSRTSDSGRSPS